LCCRKKRVEEIDSYDARVSGWRAFPDFEHADVG